MKLSDVPIHESFENEPELDKLIARLEYLSHKNEMIILNINEFCILLKDSLLDPITNWSIIKTGHYGTIFGMRLFVSKKIPQGHYGTETMMVLL